MAERDIVEEIESIYAGFGDDDVEFTVEHTLLKRAVAEIRRHRRTGPWQMIKTAPRDGTTVLLSIPRIKQAAIGSFEVKEHFRHGKSEWKKEYWSIPYFMGFDYEPSHWMPLVGPAGEEIT